MHLKLPFSNIYISKCRKSCEFITCIWIFYDTPNVFVKLSKLLRALMQKSPFPPRHFFQLMQLSAKGVLINFLFRVFCIYWVGKQMFRLIENNSDNIDTFTIFFNLFNAFQSSGLFFFIILDKCMTDLSCLFLRHD